MQQRLIFVYNARDDLFSKTLDMVHKIVSPNTYSCELCTLTYGDFTVKKQWKSFLDNLPHKKEFYYKNQWELSKTYIDAELPVILIHTNDAEKPKILISRNEMLQLKGLTGLMEEMKRRLDKL